MRFLLLLTVSVPYLLAQKLVIDAGAVIDGRGGVFHNKRITIEGSRIASITDAEGTPADIDLRQSTLMPGWIDTHVHLVWHPRK